MSENLRVATLKGEHFDGGEEPATECDTRLDYKRFDVKGESKMQINKINSVQSFGKTPVLACIVKDKSNKGHNATLYKMDPYNFDDRKEIGYSTNTRNIKRDFFDAPLKDFSAKDFYMLKNDKTGEVISCAQTEHRYRTGNSQNPGLSTLIEELEENNKYVNSAEPLLAAIVKNARERFDSSVYTAFRTDDENSLKRAKFTPSHFGEYYLPEKRYDTLMQQAENHSQIQYLV